MIGPNSVRDSAEKLKPILEKANNEHKDVQPLVVGKKDILDII